MCRRPRRSDAPHQAIALHTLRRPKWPVHLNSRSQGPPSPGHTPGTKDAASSSSSQCWERRDHVRRCVLPNHDVDVGLTGSSDLSAHVDPVEGVAIALNDTQVSFWIPYIDNIIQTHTSGDFFPTGTSTVLYTVSDSYGNTSTSSFDVVITDTEDPTITTTSVSQTADSGSCEAAVSVSSPTTGDNCGVSSIVNDYNGTSDASDTYSLGTTTVTWTVTDNSGNSSTAIQSITVTDDENPTISTSSSVSATNDSGQCKATVSLAQPTTGDNCGVSTVTSDAPGNSLYNVGTSTVTWTATDIYGNSSTTTQDVIVTDTESPVISTPLAVSATADAGSCESQVSISVVPVTDNCGVSSMVNDYNNTSDASDTYSLGTTTVTWTETDK